MLPKPRRRRGAVRSARRRCDPAVLPRFAGLCRRRALRRAARCVQCWFVIGVLQYMYNSYMRIFRTSTTV